MLAKTYEVAKLKELARECRIDIIKMLAEAGNGHPGGSLSEIEILVALYAHEMNHDPSNRCKPGRDRFVLSKGHGIPGLYAIMANVGYWAREDLLSLRKLGSPFQGHPDRCRLNGLEASTGSLGQGLSIAVGLALASKLERDNFRVYCLVGDGESQEGQIWEAAMSASKYKLDNMICILDYNKAQIDGYVEDVMPIEPVADKWISFGWHVIQIDGHNFEQIIAAFDEAKSVKGKPTFIIADTVKGKGVSFMENKVDWHGVAPSAEQAEQALQELYDTSH
ncbi:MAG: transketolase [Candidatus Latescibacteria bacterium]|nr:transketolase [Candidatus Latescibacterota bacterium]